MRIMHAYIKLEAADAATRSARKHQFRLLNSYPAYLKDSITNITCTPVIVRSDSSSWTRANLRIPRPPSAQVIFHKNAKHEWISLK